jgi:gamma-glutamylcyclotransferase (GGCT)/AIG2-like uncharacterized protein YtfP
MNERENIMLYFAYGSNMSSRRLCAENRVPSARRLCLATLPEHRLTFHKKSNDGSAKCDAYFTGDKADYVIGVLFEISQSEKRNLDRAEGLGYGYREEKITVMTDSGEQNAVAYFATDIDSSLKPYDWYNITFLSEQRRISSQQTTYR